MTAQCEKRRNIFLSLIPVINKRASKHTCRYLLLQCVSFLTFLCSVSLPFLFVDLFIWGFQVCVWLCETFATAMDGMLRRAKTSQHLFENAMVSSFENSNNIRMVLVCVYVRILTLPSSLYAIVILWRIYIVFSSFCLPSQNITFLDKYGLRCLSMPRKKREEKKTRPNRTPTQQKRHEYYCTYLHFTVDESSLIKSTHLWIIVNLVAICVVFFLQNVRKMNQVQLY